MIFTIVGLTLWIGVTVLVTVLADDPASGRPTLLAFAGGGAIFFEIVFGAALWQTRPRSDPELDLLVAELTIGPASGRGAGAVVAMRTVGRAYIVLGAVVTLLGFVAVVQEATGAGGVRTTITAMLVIVVLWALAIPVVMRLAKRASEEALAPLGLVQSGAVLEGERHGRDVHVRFAGSGWVTRVDGDAKVSSLQGDEVRAFAGRGSSETWLGVSVDCSEGKVVVRRSGRGGNTWLWDLWLAERLLT